MIQLHACPPCLPCAGRITGRSCIEHAADIGPNPLRASCGGGSVYCSARVLLQNRAVGVQGPEGKSPLELATSEEVLDLLQNPNKAEEMDFA